MTTIPALKMRPGYTITMSGTSVPLYAKPHKVRTHPVLHTLTKLPTKSDAHRKIFGHILLIVAGLLAAGIEIDLNFTPMILTITQFILPAVVQEAYDFKWKL